MIEFANTENRIRGGAETWDDGAAGVVLASDYFAAGAFTLDAEPAGLVLNANAIGLSASRRISVAPAGVTVGANAVVLGVAQPEAGRVTSSLALVTSIAVRVRNAATIEAQMRPNGTVRAKTLYVSTVSGSARPVSTVVGRVQRDF